MAHHDKHRDRRNVQPGAGEPGETDEQEDLERALQRDPIDLPGDMEEDRNLSGSSTYETLAEEADTDDVDDVDDLEDPDDLDDEGRIFLDDNR